MTENKTPKLNIADNGYPVLYNWKEFIDENTVAVIDLDQACFISASAAQSVSLKITHKTDDVEFRKYFAVTVYPQKDVNKDKRIDIIKNGATCKNKTLFWGSGRKAENIGGIQYGTGNVELTTWTPNIDNTLTLQGLTTTTDMLPIHHVSFRTPTIPIRPASLTVTVAAMSGGQLTLTANEAGVIETAQAHGLINYETGFVDIYFYTKTEIIEANRPAIEAEEWYLPQLEFQEAGKTYINVPYWIDATSVRYNAIAYTYIPLDSEILGLSATRLPPDGRVPIFRVGDIGVIASSKLQQLPSHVAGQTYDLADQRISWCELEDANGAKVPYDMYTVNYDYGKVTLSGDFALNTLVAPISPAIS